ncbi:FecR family protein [Lacibacter sp. H407]|uniref:FecR family protein n=1 Tax=Lacibacter sp. H407 TaxID=3133423 RepID=UPI0030C52BC3
MKITDQLIEQFFQDQCNASEVEAVIAYLNEHPGVVEQYIGEADWSDFQQMNRLHPVVSEKMLSTIRQSTYGEVKARTWLRYVAAAAVLITIGFGVNYFTRNGNEVITEQTAVVEKDSASPVLKLVTNKTKNAQEIKLADGSVVMLEANSELQYYEPFEAEKRSFYLKGEAYFKVAKDKTKPFTVYSNEISTTALGTAFTVSAFETNAMITVKLHEGRVVVKGGVKSTKLERDYFLIPGDEFRYNRTTNVATVVRSSKPLSNKKNGDVKTDDENESNWFMFNNQKLSQVLDQLSAIYNVKIEYSGTELNKMNFIGKIEKSDSIEQILNDIALLNNLTVTKTDSGYSIRRK